VRGGSSLSKALDNQKGVFSRFYVNMIRAGEAGGSLPTVMLRLAEYMERAKALRDNVSASLTYPAFLAVISVLAVVVLLGVVVPRFKPIFAGAGKAVPAMTQFVLWMGDAMRNFWWAIIAAVVLVVLVVNRRLKEPETRYRVDRWLVTAPWWGRSSRASRWRASRAPWARCSPTA
jgi:general secretion pathway protein F